MRSIWIRSLNIWVKGNLAQTLLSEHPPTHTSNTDCSTRTTKMNGKNGGAIADDWETCVTGDPDLTWPRFFAPKRNTMKWLLFTKRFVQPEIADRSGRLISLTELPWCQRQCYRLPCVWSQPQRRQLPLLHLLAITHPLREMRWRERGDTALRYAVINSRIGAHVGASAESRSLTSSWRQKIVWPT